jgi:hypothetical protein
MKTSMAGPLGVLSGASAVATIVVDEDVDAVPLGVLSGAPAAATIIVDEDIDAGPPWGCLSFSPS